MKILAKLLKIWKWLEGKKTYVAAIGLACYAVLGLVLHQHDLDTTIHTLGEAAGIAGLRKAID